MGFLGPAEAELSIRVASPSDLEAVLSIQRSAFGSDEEANLVADLLADPSAQPSLSLLAVVGDRAVGHILFTAAHLDPAASVSISILAPLAVIPSFQKQGIGGQLIVKGMELLSSAGVGWVFVLGYPTYYPQFGFQPAGALGFAAPYPIAPHNAAAWMVSALRSDGVGTDRGTVICAETLNRPHYWQE